MSASEKSPTFSLTFKTCRKSTKIFKKLRTFLRNFEEISEKFPENFWETPRKLLKNPKKYLENPKNCRKWVLRKNLPLPRQCPKTYRKSEKIFVEILSNSEGISEKFWEILRNAQEYFATKEKFWKTVKNECFGKISHFLINVQNLQKSYENL